MNHNTFAVIMAGGIGTRFWPFSRTDSPKQFRDILGTGKTLLQMTVARLSPICPQANIYVVTNQNYYSLVKQQLPFLSDSQILLEPQMRNTAACVAYACYKIHQLNPQANVIVAPADHLIVHEIAFINTLNIALEAAAQSQILLTLGIQPTRPDTGYGYIQMSDQGEINMLTKVKTFTEKPNLALALEFIDSGDYLWNAGIFVWNVNAIIAAFRQYMPELHSTFEESQVSFFSDSETETIQHVYSQLHNISIDYGIMEKADNVYVIKCDLGWSDLGTWKSLYEYSDKDENYNVISGNTLTYDTSNTLIKTPEHRLVVVQGLHNYIVVEHGNVLLICQKDKEQQIKQILEDVRFKKGEHFC